jgi:hypothetical protein
VFVWCFARLDLHHNCDNGFAFVVYGTVVDTIVKFICANRPRFRAPREAGSVW